MSSFINFVPDRFATSNVAFIYSGMAILNINHNNINNGDTNCDEDYPDTITLVRLLTWYIKS